VGGAADGWVPTFWPYRHLCDGRALIDAGAQAAGRDPGAIEIAPFVGIVPFDDPAMARGMIKPLVSFYIGGMGTYYHAMFCRYGFEANANEVRDLYNAGKRKEAAAAVSDALVDAIAICGTPEQCRAKLADWQAAGVGTFLMNLPTGAPFELAEQLLRTMAPA
jgi:alkanesulfonate monooxygenase SsuD/methylene tetrahydromethanopterin reductase-like flavin-dependent oxidoreductase (luciferase family)